MSLEPEIILFHWNILELQEDLAIFVGLRHRNYRPGLSFPYSCSLRFSTSIKNFDELTGVGTTMSGRIYHCIGGASDPHGLIRRAISEKMAGRYYRFRYPFNTTND